MKRRKRRLKGRCYFCGDPTLSEWYCREHLWAEGLPITPASTSPLGKLTREHVFWMERMTPEQIIALAGYVDEEVAA